MEGVALGEGRMVGRRHVIGRLRTVGGGNNSDGLAIWEREHIGVMGANWGFGGNYRMEAGWLGVDCLEAGRLGRERH